MTYTIVGLGNPKEENEKSRHNVGRVVLEKIRMEENFPEWNKDKYSQALLARGVLCGAEVLLVEPDNYMNNSGESVRYFIQSPGDAEELIVVHDDMYVPIGEIKISYGKGDGGHNGIKSIIKNVGTKEFVRVRVGVAQKNLFGKIKKQEDKAKFVLKNFSLIEKGALDEGVNKAVRAVQMIVKEGRGVAANTFN